MQTLADEKADAGQGCTAKLKATAIAQIGCGKGSGLLPKRTQLPCVSSAFAQAVLRRPLRGLGRAAAAPQKTESE